MFDAALQGLVGLIERGQWAMYPLLALSIVAVTLIFERCWFWVVTNNPWRIAKLRRAARHLRDDNAAAARALVDGDRSVYGRLVRQMLDEGHADAAVTDAVERQRGAMDRFMPTLGTIITAAPMLGILGTVTGIIGAFDLLGGGEIQNVEKVGGEIGEALITTGTGLVIALIVVFPYNAFRAQVDRTLGRMETLVAAARKQPPVED
jgi:biopolymer transport protein ExbB